MGLLTDILSNPLHAAVLGAIVGAAACYVYLTQFEAGRAYARTLDQPNALCYDSVILYGQAAAAGAAVAGAASYFLLSKRAGSGGGYASALSAAPLMAGMSDPLMDGADNQTMLTEAFE